MATLNIPNLLGVSAIALLSGSGQTLDQWTDPNPGSGGGDTGGGTFTAPNAPRGSQVGTASATFTVPDVPVAPCSLFIDAGTVSQLAPLANVGTVYEAEAHEYTWEWWINGSPLEAYTAPENMPEYWNNPNRTYGAKAGLLLPTAGTYEIRGRAIDANGDYAYITYTQVVQDPDTVYAGSDTLCLSLVGDFDGAPSGAAQHSSLSSLNSAIGASTSPIRVLIRRGETVVGQIENNAGDWLTYVGAFGDAADPRPILRPNNFDGAACLDWSSNSSNVQIIMTDLEFWGYWDASTEVEYGNSQSFAYDNSTEVDFVTFYNIDHHGMEGPDFGTTSDPATHKNVMVANSSLSDWLDYGMFVGGNQTGRIAVLGCRIVQNPDAMQTTIDKPRLGNQHGPLRATGPEWIVLDICDIFSNDGWSGGNTQPCLRFGTNQNADDLYGHVGRCVLENGYQLINGAGENAAAQDNPGNMIFDRILMIATSRTNNNAVDWHKGGVTFRNIYLWHPNVEHARDSNYFNRMFNGVPNNSQGSNNSEPFRVYNCALYSELDDTNDGTAGAAEMMTTSSFTNVINDNNIIYVPNAASPETVDGPFDVSTFIPNVTPRFKGVKVNYEHVEGNDTWNDGDTLFVPYSDLRVLDHEGRGSGAITDQAYWLANAATDTKHKISWNNGQPVLYAANNQFTVSFDATGVTLTNTSGNDRSGDWQLQLDRRSRFDTELGLDATKANPANVPALIPTAASPAATPTDAVFVTHDWFGDEVLPADQYAGVFRPLAA